MSILGSLVDEETAVEIGALYNTAREQYSEVKGDLDATLQLKNDLIAEYQAGQATLQELGLLPAPAGQPEGGRWIYVEGTGDAQYFPPGSFYADYPVEQWPEWLPMSIGTGSTISYILGGLYFDLGATLDDVKQVSEMDPISGIAPQGTDFGQLNPQQKRAYLANSYAVAAARFLHNSPGYNSAVGALRQQELDLGFAKQGTCTHEPRDTVCADGTPLTNALWDKQDAAMRLYAALKGLTVPDLVGRTTGTTPTIPSSGPGTECFGLNQEECVSCVKEYKDPGVAEFLDVCYRPYLAVHTPGKTIEYVTGPDKRGYLVLEMGGRVHGVRLLTALLAAGAAAVGGITAYLTKTKKGKRLAKRLGFNR